MNLFKKLRDVFSSNKKGDKVKIGVVVQDNSGNEKTLLNPYGKSKKYADELKLGFKLTNEWIPKDKDLRDLTKEERAYRAGYIDSQRDNAKAYKAKKAKKNKKF